MVYIISIISAIHEVIRPIYLPSIILIIIIFVDHVVTGIAIKNKAGVGFKNKIKYRRRYNTILHTIFILIIIIIVRWIVFMIPPFQNFTTYIISFLIIFHVWSIFDSIVVLINIIVRKNDKIRVSLTKYIYLDAKTDTQKSKQTVRLDDFSYQPNQDNSGSSLPKGGSNVPSIPKTKKNNDENEETIK